MTQAAAPSPERPWRGRRVLGVFPHPDDETWAAGGLLALCARGGADVRVVSLTRGEAGTDRARRVPPGPALAALRSDELADACRALGLTAPPEHLDLPDGAVRDAPSARAALAHLLARHAPDLVVALGPDGGYGHVDHVATTALIAATCAALARPLRVLHAVFPCGLFGPLARALARSRHGRRLLAPLDPSDLGVDPAPGDLALDLAALGLAAPKRAALAAHRSQLPNGDPGAFLDPAVTRALLATERFRVALGPPLPVAPSDPFAGLAPPPRAGRP